MDLSDLMASDADEASSKAPSDQQLSTIADLAQRQLDLEKEVEAAEKTLADLNKKLARVRDKELPEALEAANVRSVTLFDGSSISICETLFTSIPQDNKTRAFKWLRETSNDGIIKNEISCSFGKGQDSEAKNLEELLKTGGYSFKASTTVHPQTLKAFVKGRLEGGEFVPQDIFSIHIKKASKIERPK